MRPVERAADGQERVADRLGLEPPDVRSAREPVLRVDLRRLRVVASLPIW